MLLLVMTGLRDTSRSGFGIWDQLFVVTAKDSLVSIETNDLQFNDMSRTMRETTYETMRETVH